MAPTLEPVAPGRRFLWALVAWLAIAASQPGLGRPEGFGHTALVALAPWGLVCCRPGRRAFLAEWGAAAIGLVLLMLWMRYLFPWLVPLLGMVPAVYHAASGFALRSMARRFPLALAVPAAWMLGELARWYLPPPLSFGWWRLGTFLHDTEWVAGSARVWGTWGLSWICAAFAGWCADLWRLRGLAPDAEPPFPGRRVHLLGLGPLALGVVLTVVVPPPETEHGPRVLLVQPGIEQELKKRGKQPEQVWLDMVRQTAEGLEAAAGPVDLVCWGETMFPYRLVRPGVDAALERGWNLPAYTGRELDQESLDLQERAVSLLIETALFGAGTDARLEGIRGLPAEVLRPGGLLGEAAFVTGLLELVVGEGELRHRNALALWSEGELVGTAAKVHLVPAAEDPRGWVHLPLLKDVMRRVGGFVPDFLPAERPEVLPVPGRDGGAWRVSGTVCYDQAFDDVYAARADEVDLHLVLSNEAWYERSAEMDHMVAFARLDAVATGRSVVRATNSGVSCVLDPSGVLLGRVEDERGRAKMVRGNLDAVVPVPVERVRTPWVATHRWQPLLWALLALGPWVFSRNRRPAAG